MPHMHLETTADLVENAHIPDMLEALVARLCAYDTISPASVKAYHTLRSNWSMGAGAAPGFAHATVAILEGRPLELRKKISQGMYEELQSLFKSSTSAGDVQLTLELREMASETYHK